MMNTFINRLKELLALSGKMQKDISRDLGVSKQHLTHWKSGYCQPDLDDLVTLAKYFNVSIDYLLGLEDEFGSPTREAQAPALRADSSVGFFHEHKSLLSDPYFIKTAKLYNAIDRSKRAMLFGYIVGFLQEQGVNIDRILS